MYKLKILAAFVLPAMLAATALLAYGEVRVDSCLDNGGRWDYKDTRCEGVLREVAGSL
ncbi:hypothetical protein [Massilia cavernae]|uniref:hypothetical protein n=1 Tax=Massilia cavernae TaxID=2320864 RepID=UPI001603E80A|nr:hypothetical protein [Massilia cavernae]